MDKQLERAMQTFYGSPIGWTTDDIYGEYFNICAIDGVEPRPKSVIIREVCNEFNCEIEARVVKTFRKQGFVRGDDC